MQEKVLIIAEAGVNHNGDLKIARELIDVACSAGADIIKFQTFKADQLVDKNAVKAAYQVRNTGNSESQFDMVKKYELGYSEHIELMAYCVEKEIQFLSSPFDLDSIELINQLGLNIIKIPSGELTNLPYLEKVSELKANVILSTGMATIEEIRSAIDVITRREILIDDITVLHCNTEYPTPYEDVNLRAMQTIRNEFEVKVGYSDHTQGIEIPIAATALGATVIEKHITLDRNMEGPDHRSSLEPNELAAMVKAIRHIEVALGNGVKEPSKSEIVNREIVRKSIYLRKNQPKGHVLQDSDLVMKRPAHGISPMDTKKVVGKHLNKEYQSGEILRWEDLL